MSPLAATTHPGARGTRRDFFARAGGGCCLIALASLRDTDGLRGGDAAPDPRAPKAPHFEPKVKRVIWLFMHGGPSQVDLLDPKPDLERFAGKPLPGSFGEVMTRRKVARNPLLAPIKPFHRHGKSGLEISEFLPHIAGCADDLAVIRSCHGDSVNHPQSVYQMNTGSILMGKPSVGSWVSYGLGTENRDMPTFVVMPDPRGGLKGGPPAWGSGFLPATHQGTPMRAGGEPILNLAPSSLVSAAQQRGTLDLVRRLNSRHLDGREFDSELSARIDSYELAYRMQTAAPDIVDLGNESRSTLELYGVGEKDTEEFGRRCLLARRMIERGVRFVQLYSGDTGGWDAHKNVLSNHSLWSRRTDKPIAGLLRDLQQRGLFEETLVVWGGEFGRMPMSEQGAGRDHNPWGYSVWLAGGGVRGGTVYGSTDAIGLRAEHRPVHVHDLHATILHLLGIDHERLTFLHNGREDRLTNVSGSVVRGVLT